MRCKRNNVNHINRLDKAEDEVCHFSFIIIFDLFIFKTKKSKLLMLHANVSVENWERKKKFCFLGSRW